MIVLLIVFAAVFIIWLITQLMQKLDKKAREDKIKLHQEEKKEQEEKESQSPLKR